MDDAKTKKTWGVYDETGIFMVQTWSRVASTQNIPWQWVSKLMAAFSDGLGGGYNIGSINAYFKHNDVFEICANLSGWRKRKNTSKTLVMSHWRKRCTWSTGRGWGSLKQADTWSVFEPVNSITYGGDTRVTWQNETLHQHAQENYDKDLLVVQELECYKLRKHIAKALQTHSVAIKVALDHYNKCVLAMQLPHQMLQWEQVVEYAFLANFNLLWDMHEDISQHPWVHATFNGSHLKHLHDIAMLLGFSGTLYPGVSTLKGRVPVQPLLSQILHQNALDSIQDLEEEEEVECQAKEASHALQDVLEVSLDPE
ncbi:hypothetical protein F5141DRAFT_1066835 [Pisolithus sp. B1]|nr:hypothetical protein F5141DRAFT_1066835 [Pisolithus sp. B1]